MIRILGLMAGRGVGPTSAGIARKAVQTENAPRRGGGSVAVTFNDADNDDDISAGDRLSLPYANCVLDGERTNGTIELLIAAATRSGVDDDPTSLDGTVAVRDFSFGSDTDAPVANGGYRFVLSTPAADRQLIPSAPACRRSAMPTAPPASTPPRAA